MDTGKGLPKFDSTGWLLAGAFFSLLVFSLALWAMISGQDRAFLPFRLGQLLSMAVALALGIHCLDMIGYYRRHGRLKD